MSFLINPYRFAADPLLTGLVAWWSLDEASGTRVNSHTPGTLDLTDNNTVGQTTGKVSNAAAFVAASDEQLSHAYSSSLVMADRDFTCAGWFIVTNASEGNCLLIGQGRPILAQLGWSVMRNGSNQQIQVRARNAANSGNIQPTAVDIPAYDTWMFVLAQFTNATSELSIAVNNGTPQTATGALFADTTETFKIGGSSDDNRSMTGASDEVAIWHRILTTDEKNRLYNGGAGMAYPG